MTAPRRCLLALWALLGPLLVACAGEPPARPNIVLLIADDLGWNGISSARATLGYASKFHETPNIDRLADQGMSFTAAYVQQDCAPTRASLITGQYAPRNGVYHHMYLGDVAPGLRDKTQIVVPAQHADVDPATVSVAETLRAAGYLTAIVGKARGFRPYRALGKNHGFEVNLSTGQVQRVPRGKTTVKLHYFARKTPAGEWVLPSRAYDRYAQPYSEGYVATNLLPVANGNDPRSLVGTPKHLTDAMADAANEFIAEHAGGERPFFLMVAFAAVHNPFRARPDLLAKYAKKRSSDPRHARPDYAALLEGLDQSVGRIVARLDDPNGDGDPTDSIRRDTLVVFLSDNGAAAPLASNAPLRMGKGSLWEGGVRVPFIASMPGSIAPGSVSHEAVHVVDLYPSFAAFAGAPLPDPTEHPLDGESLAGILTGRTKRLARDALYWHFPGYIDTRLTPTSIVNKRVDGRRYKLIYTYEDERYALYDLEDDLGEQRDLLQGSPSAEHRAIARGLSQDLRRWLVEVRAQRGQVRATGRPVPLPKLAPRS